MTFRVRSHLPWSANHPRRSSLIALILDVLLVGTLCHWRCRADNVELTMSGRQCRADTRKISQISSYGGETSWTRLQQRQSLLPTSVGRFQALVLPLNPMCASRLEPNRACSWPCTSVCKQRTRELVLGWLRLAGCSMPTSPQQPHVGGSRRDRRARREPSVRLGTARLLLDYSLDRGACSAFPWASLLPSLAQKGRVMVTEIAVCGE